MKPTVLLVDDEPNVLRALERVLRKDGYRILTAESGLEAVRRMQAETELAFVLCDQRMPGMSGAEVLREAQKFHPLAVRVTLTGQAGIGELLETVNEGRVARILLKPWDDEALRELVREGVEEYRARRENERLQRELAAMNAMLEDFSGRLEATVQERTAALVQAKERLETSLKDVVLLLGDLLQMHAPGLRGRAGRVAGWARRTAEALGMDGENVFAVEVAAHLHQLGLMSVPEALLAKDPQALTKREQQRLERHPLIGALLLGRIAGFDEAVAMLKHQCERYAGGGFPDGLERDRIPLGARVLQVAQTFEDALHPPGQALAAPLTLAEATVRKASGAALDPAAVDAFLGAVLPRCDDAGSWEIETAIENLRPGMILARDVVNIAGVALLRKGTRLDEHAVENLRRNEEFDAAVSRVYVRRRSIPGVEPAVAATVETAEDEADEAEEKPLVFVLDDQLHVVSALKRELRRAGYRVRGFREPLECLVEILRVEDAFAVICDYRMPGMKGDEFVHRLQAERPELPCVVLTAHATRGTVEQFVRAGRIRRILTKPWDKETLLQTLREIREA